jgi:pimeloyl-ACP methyl ester carboxylesterase
VRTAEDDVEVVTIHGYGRAYVRRGSGPAVLLLHGLGGDLGTWDRVLPALAEHHTVIAPDLLGHGRSDKPRADYSLGGYANGMRDLLTVLGVDRVTVVGHSFGGGVAMQFAYQYPERTERIVLVGSGGLGREVSPVLRLLTVPGSGVVLGALASTPVRQIATGAVRAALHLPWIGDGRLMPALADGPELLDGFNALAHADSRSAFLHVLRAAVEPSGQVVTMLDRSYLAAAIPTLLVWGDRDSVIPVAHARRGAVALPGSRLVIVPGAGHFPHRDEPGTFVAAVEDFLATTEPATHSRARFGALLRSGGGGPVPVRVAEGRVADRRIADRRVADSPAADAGMAPRRPAKASASGLRPA